ncbi:hypothetical protein DEU42_11421 [Flavobacterium sp. AG291]|nr:hypothetical protein DEU42_11421 [Flavobacterium sp. AG291]
MIDFILKAGIIAVFFIIFLQDFRDRLVYWFLYPLVGVIGYIVQAKNLGYELSLVYSLINLSIIIILLLILFLYSRLKLKMNFINGTMGIGDILLLLFLSFIFPTTTFVVLFVFSLFFSLLIHYFLKNTGTHKNVPLAGYIALFFLFIYVASFFLEPYYLYS